MQGEAAARETEGGTMEEVVEQDQTETNYWRCGKHQSFIIARSKSRGRQSLQRIPEVCLHLFCCSCISLLELLSLRGKPKDDNANNALCCVRPLFVAFSCTLCCSASSPPQSPLSCACSSFTVRRLFTAYLINCSRQLVWRY